MSALARFLGSARLVAPTVGLALAAGVLSPAHAADPDELREQLAEVEQRASRLDERADEVDDELAGARAKVAELERELGEAEEALARAQERERRANQEAETARIGEEHARRSLAEAEAALEANGAELGSVARDTYKHGAPRSSAISLVGAITSSEGPSEISDAVSFLRRGVGQWSVLVEESTALVARVDALAQRAQEERRRRDAALADAAEARDEAAEAHARVMQLASEASVEQERLEELIERLERQRERAEERIGDLEEEIEAEERRIAEEEARRKAEAEARRKAEAEERRKAEAEKRRKAEAEKQRREQAEKQRREQAEKRPEPKAAEPKAAKPKAAKPAASGSGGGSKVVSAGNGLVTVQGITVDAELGSSLAALLDAARADGIVLGGSGYRSPKHQAALRRTNGCPDVYDSPASSCRVPTARPGSSEHEKGLAVDFSWQGRTICFPQSSSACNGNPAFDWLEANAGKYGFKNLPSEAWHWSTTGH